MKLKKHPSWELLPIAELSSFAPDESPGEFIRHIDHPRSFGIIVANDGVEWSDPEKDAVATNPEVLVLWSNPPFEIELHSQEIKSTSRKLKVRWSAELAGD